MKEPKTVELKLGPLPPSCLGPDGRFRKETIDGYFEPSRWGPYH